MQNLLVPTHHALKSERALKYKLLTKNNLYTLIKVL